MTSTPIAGLVLVLVATAGLGSCTSLSRQPTQTFLVTVEAYASPTCPAARPAEGEPPDPECAPRPVAGAIIEVTNPAGRRVETLTTDQSGQATVSLPAGTHTFHPRPVEGLPGTPEPRSLSVADDLPGLGLVFEYDAAPPPDRP